MTVRVALQPSQVWPERGAIHHRVAPENKKGVPMNGNAL
jgi:hypothetical protein